MKAVWTALLAGVVRFAGTTLLVGTITPGIPLAAGATVNVEFKLGVMRKGPYRFIVNIEAK